MGALQDGDFSRHSALSEMPRALLLGFVDFDYHFNARPVV